MMNLWMDTAQTRWTVRHKQHIGQEACFFAGGSVGTKLGTGIAQASIAGLMSLCGYDLLAESGYFIKSLSLRHCGCPLSCI